jgi:hypothetical protein
MTRTTTNALIAGALALLLFTGLSAALGIGGRVREPLVGALSAVGLYQPEWRLFAPNVHKTNSYLTAEVVLADGTTRHWSSPDFTDRSQIEKFSQGQLPKLYDNVRLDRNRAAWRPFAEWVAREVAPNEAVRSVRLIRHFFEIPPPGPDSWSAPRPQRSEYRTHVFYERWF